MSFGTLMRMSQVEPSAEMSELMTKLDPDRTNFSYFASGQNGKSVLASTYPKEWIDRYERMQYSLIDPVMTGRTKTLLPANWADSRTKDSMINDFFDDAQGFGVFKQGMTIPVCDSHGHAGALFINVDATDREWSGLYKHILSDTMLLGIMFHEKIMEQNMEVPEGDIPSLTLREIAALTWAARGKTAWETSVIFGVSESAIKKYLYTAGKKLGARNSTQSVAIAIMFGIIPIEHIR